ncbi:MAG: heavy-metal-associated domain-containing protein [Vicingaceae bacterium]
MIKKELKVEGMSCGHCTAAVERLLIEVDGVQSATASLPSNVVVEFDENKTSIEGLKKTINDSEIYKA